MLASSSSVPLFGKALHIPAGNLIRLTRAVPYRRQLLATRFSISEIKALLFPKDPEFKSRIRKLTVYSTNANSSFTDATEEPKLGNSDILNFPDSNNSKTSNQSSNQSIDYDESKSTPDEEVCNPNPFAYKNTKLRVVLVNPQIPGNTGSIARTCAATSVGLHLIEPLGFQIDDSKLKRAGLDYWPHVVVKVHSSWNNFFEYFSEQDDPKRLIAFSKFGNTKHTDFNYQDGDWLLFGSETNGLPPDVVQECKQGKFGGGVSRIPIIETHVRSLNLSVAAGVALYEALRQINPTESPAP